MKKILLNILLYFLVFQSLGYSQNITTNDDIQKKFNKQKVKIEKNMEQKNYKNALKQIRKIKKYSKNLQKNDIDFLSKNEKICIDKINQRDFWKRYYIEEDDFIGAIKYYPNFNFGFIKPFIIAKGKDINIYTDINFAYQSANWLFIRNAIIKYDDKTFNFFPEDAGSNVYCASALMNCNYYEYKRFDWTNNVNILRKIGDSGGVVIRAYGKNHYKDYYLNPSSIQKIKQMVELYDYLKSNK